MKDKNLLYLILKKIDKAVLLILFNTILVSNTLNYKNGGFGGIGLNMSNTNFGSITLSSGGGFELNRTFVGGRSYYGNDYFFGGLELGYKLNVNNKPIWLNILFGGGQRNIKESDFVIIAPKLKYRYKLSSLVALEMNLGYKYLVFDYSPNYVENNINGFYLGSSLNLGWFN
tara:strand:- start:88 stop:603 length:516 start_codon:yes stop_codon:yes gene_type:complete